MWVHVECDTSNVLVAREDMVGAYRQKLIIEHIMVHKTDGGVSKAWWEESTQWDEEATK